MKAIISLTVFVTTFLFSGFAFKDNQPKDLLGKKAPLLNTVTIDGIAVDSTFYNGKVTLLNFMYIACKPCMVEIPTLNKIHREIKSDKFQMVSIAAHTHEQVTAFLSDSNSVFSAVRKRFKIDTISFKLIAECESQNEETKQEEIELMCNTISKSFYVQGYPTTFLIDQQGYVRKVFEGFSLTGMDTVIERNMKTEIAKLINGDAK